MNLTSSLYLTLFSNVSKKKSLFLCLHYDIFLLKMPAWPYSHAISLDSAFQFSRVILIQSLNILCKAQSAVLEFSVTSENHAKFSNHASTSNPSLRMDIIPSVTFAYDKEFN